jgi:hypothetical protein
VIVKVVQKFCVFGERMEGRMWEMLGMLAVNMKPIWEL